MRIWGSRVSFVTFVVTLILAATAVALSSTGAARTQPSLADDQATSLAAWDQIATVLEHPRCLNCHQLNSPLQGDSRRVHIPRVVRGPDDQGVGAMRCGNCHNSMGNNPTSGTPGGLDWKLAPVSMLWEGLSSRALGRAVKDTRHNGHCEGDALIRM